MKIIRFIISVIKDVLLKLLYEIKFFLAIAIIGSMIIIPMFILPTIVLKYSNSEILFILVFILEGIIIDVVVGKKNSGTINFIRNSKKKLKEKYESMEG